MGSGADPETEDPGQACLNRSPGAAWKCPDTLFQERLVYWADRFALREAELTQARQLLGVRERHS